MSIEKRAKGIAITEQLGPGLVTGAADDDPSGIATYSQAGAQFGYGLLWTMVLTYPLMAAVQLVSAHIGRVTGKGLASNMRKRPAGLAHHGPRWAAFRDQHDQYRCGSRGDGSSCRTRGGQGRACFHCAIRPSVARSAAVHSLSSLREYPQMADAGVACLFRAPVHGEGRLAGRCRRHGPAQSYEQGSRHHDRRDLRHDDQPVPILLAELAGSGGGRSGRRQESTQGRAGARDEFRRIKIDTFVGMAVSNVVALAIIIGTAATLHAAGKTEIATAADAAKALQPVAGKFAFLIFSLGIIGTGLLAIPVLAGSVAYAIGDSRGWKTSLESMPWQAKGFYTVIGAATLLGIGIDWSPIDPIKALFWSAVINGVVAVPIMVVMMLVASNREAMGKFTISASMRVFGWLATAVMAAAAIAMAVF